MTKQPDLGDVWHKLREMDDKMDRIRGHVNVIATLNKELNREQLLEQCKKKIGPSLEMQRLWYFSRDPRTIPELQSLAEVKATTIGSSLKRLHDRGMLEKNELSDQVRYYQNEVTQDIGIDKWIESEHRKKGWVLTRNGLARSEPTPDKTPDDDADEEP